MHTTTKLWSAVALLAALTAGAPPARAEATAQEKAAAEALFDSARSLMKQGKYAEACAKFEQSQHIDPGIGTLLYLGDCYEKAGRLASAWATFREGASRAQAAGQNDRARAGEQRAQALVPRLVKVTIEVADENRQLDGFRLERAGQLVEPALWGVAVPVDPGEHTVVASAPGYERWSHKVRADTEGAALSVTVPALTPAAGAAEPPPAAAPPQPEPVPVAPAAPPPADAPPPDAGDPGATQRTLGLVVGGVGLVGIGVGTVFGLTAIAKNDDAKALCPRGDRCDDPEGVELTEDAKDAATVSNVAFGLGAAALVGGAVLYFTAPSSAPERALRIAPVVGSRGAGVSVGGRF